MQIRRGLSLVRMDTERARLARTAEALDLAGFIFGADYRPGHGQTLVPCPRYPGLGHLDPYCP